MLVGTLTRPPAKRRFDIIEGQNLRLLMLVYSQWAGTEYGGQIFNVHIREDKVCGVIGSKVRFFDVCVESVRTLLSCWVLRWAFR